MVEESLLAEVALRLAKSPEDIATEGLTYLLSRSHPVRALVQRLGEEWISRELPTIALVRSQVGAEDGSRPDLEALDAAGHPVIVFESKFWAGLTDAQPVSYLKHLKEQGGVLCFVAPRGRLPFLWVDVLTRADAAFPGAVEPVRDEPELKLARVSGNRVLALTSWSFLLGQIRMVLEENGDLSLAADARQLVGLAARMEKSGFIPLTAMDLSAPTARHILQFCRVVDDAMGQLLAEPFVSKQGLKASGGAGYYGHYFLLHGYGSQLSLNAQMWDQHGRSPIWLRVAGPDWRFSNRVEQAMVGRLGREACVSLRDHNGLGVWTALSLPVGRELEAVACSVRDQILHIADALGKSLSSGITQEIPDEADAS